MTKLLKVLTTFALVAFCEYGSFFSNANYNVQTDCAAVKLKLKLSNLSLNSYSNSEGKLNKNDIHFHSYTVAPSRMIENVKMSMSMKMMKVLMTLTLTLTLAQTFNFNTIGVSAVPLERPSLSLSPQTETQSQALLKLQSLKQSSKTKSYAQVKQKQERQAAPASTATLGLGLTAAATETPLQLTNYNIVNPSGYTGTCNIASGDREDCGFKGITKEQCTSRSCCFEVLSGNNDDNRKLCFRPHPLKIPSQLISKYNNNMVYPSGYHGTCNIDGRDRQQCGGPWITKEKCISNSCCFEIQSMRNILEGSPLCFRPRPLETPVQLTTDQCLAADKDGRRDCGYSGIDQDSCHGRDCCWDSASSSDLPQCFYPRYGGVIKKKNKRINCQINGDKRTDCGYGDEDDGMFIDGDICMERGGKTCCWEDDREDTDHGVGMERDDEVILGIAFPYPYNPRCFASSS